MSDSAPPDVDAESIAGEPGLLTRVHIRAFRSIRDATFRPGPVAALVGEPGTGKSNVLAAIRAALDPEAGPLEPADVARRGAATIQISARTHDGASVSVESTPPVPSVVAAGEMPPVIYLPAALRSQRVIAPTARRSAQGQQVARLLGELTRSRLAAEGLAASRAGTTEAARGLVAGMEACHQAGLTGVVILIEEPELFLPPQTQRYLYRVLRRLAAAGNQILYSTHSPSFVNVARLHELVLIDHDPETGTSVVQPEVLSADDEFRAYSEIDASRGELFFARAAVLVEGRTEKLALPLVFRALGYDADRERISIVECGGKSNIPLVAKISRAVGVPFIAVHDRDAPEGSRPSSAERQLNSLILEIAGGEGRVQLIPDFEGAAGLKGQRHKPARAWHSFADLEAEEVPAPFRIVVERAVALARRRAGGWSHPGVEHNPIREPEVGGESLPQGRLTDLG